MLIFTSSEPPMNPQLSNLLARQHTADLQHRAEQERGAHILRQAREPSATGFRLRGHHLAKLDRFLGHAERAARLAEREFEGVTLEVDATGSVRVHAAGTGSMVL